MTLHLYNTLTRRKQPFTPLDSNNVRMYVCGPTVYDFAHIGNARPVIVFDVLFRLLRHIYGPDHITYVRNITDVDDKINARAKLDFPALALNDAIARVTEKTTNQFHADVKALGCLQPTFEPRATDNIAQMITIIAQLLAKKHAYQAAGEVLFNTASMPDYGALSNRNLDEQQAGARVEVEAHKKNPGDFVLWKLSSAEEPGWDSPWGRGRPGWHIECSAMSERYLGPVFDIHGGGLDLIFPHHENEIAQSRCAHGTPVMANWWMHNGFLQVEGEKMSKSLGNFVTINELLRTERFGGRLWQGNVVRYAMLLNHYRQPMDWTVSSLEEAAADLASISDFLDYDEVLLSPHEELAREEQNIVLDEIVEALSDDLNSPDAIAVIRNNRRSISNSDHAKKREFLLALEYFGLIRKDKLRSNHNGTISLEMAPHDALKFRLPVVSMRAAIANGDISIAQNYAQKIKSSHEVSVEWDELSGAVLLRGTDKAFNERVQAAIAARSAARKAKNFAESDRIRDELAAMGIALKDSKNPTTGEIETTWEISR